MNTQRCTLKISNHIVKIFSLASLIMVLLAPSGRAAAELTAKANHDHIKIDFYYHGSTVSVSGHSDAGTDLIVKIASPEGQETLRRKGKVAGLLWMNVGPLTLKPVPALYFLRSTRKVEDILDKEELERNGIGYAALVKRAEIRPVADQYEHAKWFDEFVKFKESSKLYSLSSGTITLTEENGRQQYYVLNEWPHQALPGNYTVTVYAVKNKRVIETAQADVRVEQVGMIRSLAHMAKNKGGLYGIISVLAALAAGFSVGLIFRKGGGSH